MELKLRRVQVGVGVPRIRCLDCDDTVICEPCWSAFDPLRRAAAAADAAGAPAASAVAAALAAVDPHSAHACVVEANHSVLAREWAFAPSLGQLVDRAFRAYAARPCFRTVTASTADRTEQLAYCTYADLHQEVLLFLYRNCDPRSMK